MIARATLLVVCLAVSTSASAQDAKIALGQKVYGEQKCGMCHSIGAAGNKKGPLDGVGTKLSADDLRAWIVDAKGMTTKTKAARKPEMKTYSLPVDQVDGLVAYLQTLKK